MAEAAAAAPPDKHCFTPDHALLARWCSRHWNSWRIEPYSLRLLDMWINHYLRWRATLSQIQGWANA